MNRFRPGFASFFKARRLFRWARYGLAIAKRVPVAAALSLLPVFAARAAAPLQHSALTPGGIQAVHCTARR